MRWLGSGSPKEYRCYKKCPGRGSGAFQKEQQ
jgi:hypothetical protein